VNGKNSSPERHRPVESVFTRITHLTKPNTATPPRITDARGGDPTVESLDLSQPYPKKFKVEHWPHQIAASPHTVDPPRIADARGGDPTAESLDLSRPHPKKIKAIFNKTVALISLVQKIA